MRRLHISDSSTKFLLAAIATLCACEFDPEHDAVVGIQVSALFSPHYLAAGACPCMAICMRSQDSPGMLLLGSPAALASPLVLTAELAVSTTMSPSESVRLRSWERGNEEERRSVLCARRLGSVNEDDAPL